MENRFRQKRTPFEALDGAIIFSCHRCHLNAFMQVLLAQMVNGQVIIIRTCVHCICVLHAFTMCRPLFSQPWDMSCSVTYGHFPVSVSFINHSDVLCKKRAMREAGGGRFKASEAWHAYILAKPIFSFWVHSQCRLSREKCRISWQMQLHLELVKLLLLAICPTDEEEGASF